MPVLPSDPSRSGRKLPEVMHFSNSSGRPGLLPGREISGPRQSKTSGPPDPLVTSKFGNSQPSIGEGADNLSNKKQKLEHSTIISTIQRSEMDKLLAKLSPKPHTMGESPVENEEIRTQLSEKQVLFEQKRNALTDNGSLPGEEPGNKQDPLPTDTSEVVRLKRELLAANSRIALQEQELAQTRVIKHTLDQALGPPSEIDFGGREVTEQTISHLQGAFNASNPSFNQLPNGWSGQDDTQSDISDALSAGQYNRARGFWIPPAQQQAFGVGLNPSTVDKSYGDPFPMPPNSTTQESSRFWGARTPNPTVSGQSFQSNRMLPSSSMGTCNVDAHYPGDQPRILEGPPSLQRRPTTQGSRNGAWLPTQSSPWGTFNPVPQSNIAPRSPVEQNSTYQQVGLYPIPPYHQQPVGTPLSPTANEFTSAHPNVVPWGTSSAGGSHTQTYVSPLEPINYRRLLDKNVSCDWRYIVDKIVCNNDQQASIFLQQKLKVGTVQQKFEIIEAIVHQAYPLMVNRFGNFLVQRCFEHGTPEQIVAIANAIKGNTLSLSMDPFGCHVIQKAFDCVPEEQKAVMVHELLRRIPETVIHRYACHVWQKLFELRWSGEPPQIMVKVNDALKGMWHEVALGETGSLVVQNIFENCVEDEKRPAIEEVLAKIDVLSHGQFGNWCIQHICEHGAPHDKSRAIEHILLWSVDYSMDQFASKIREFVLAAAIDPECL
ncbi:armadillo-type protein [Aspergillus ambiguus]|uniref:armadillo-type protein n=1 Tax=Aspergillus ambiguus TaxID=176160 RepID=UPI003CCDA9DD